MKLLQRILLLFIIFSFVGVLTGCGQSGELYLPKAQHPEVQKHEVNGK